ncbi:MAG: hypothetical protein PHQ98_00665 [Candidatus ainarchaeum sp.]|nr:hypothetical protein [Candidatus ainarchaeum sp.]
MNIILNEKAMFYSIDLIVSFCLILITIFILMSSYFQNYNFNLNQFKDNELIEKTIFLADSFVKNRNIENSLLGSCQIDYEKKRIISNQLDESLFSKIKQLNIKNFFVKEIKLDEKQIFHDLLESKDCVTIKRYVLIKDNKKVLSLKGCKK